MGGILAASVRNQQSAALPFAPLIAMIGAFLGYNEFYWKAHYYLRVPQKYGKYIMVAIIILYFSLFDSVSKDTLLIFINSNRDILLTIFQCLEVS